MDYFKEPVNGSDEKQEVLNRLEFVIQSLSFYSELIRLLQSNEGHNMFCQLLSCLRINGLKGKDSNSTWITTSKRHQNGLSQLLCILSSAWQLCREPEQGTDLAAN